MLLLWPCYAPRLQSYLVRLTVDVRLHCILEHFTVFVTEEVFASSIEDIVTFFVCRVYEGASCNLVWPFVTVVTHGREVERNRILRNDSVNTVLGQYSCSAQEIRLLIQQRDYVPVGRGPRVVWHNWRAIDHWSDSDSDSGGD